MRKKEIILRLKLVRNQEERRLEEERGARKEEK